MIRRLLAAMLRFLNGPLSEPGDDFWTQTRADRRRDKEQKAWEREYSISPTPLEPILPALLLESCVVMGDDYFWFGETTPRTALGVCKECGQHWSVGHRGTCSYSIMRSGGMS